MLAKKIISMGCALMVIIGIAWLSVSGLVVWVCYPFISKWW